MDYVMNYVAITNNLNIDDDIKFIGEGSPSILSDYLLSHLNQTQIGVIFCNTEWIIYGQISIPCKFQKNFNNKLIFYSIVYNASLFSSIAYFQDFSIGLHRDLVASRVNLTIITDISI